MIYNNLATLADGTVVAGRLTLVSTSNSNLRIDLTGGNGSEILMNGNSNTAVRGAEAKFRLEFIDQTTGAPVALNSVGTFNDIDRASNGTESVKLEGSSFSSFATTSNTALTVTQVGGQVIASGGIETNPNDQRAWFSGQFENRTFIEFTTVARGGPSGYTLSGNLITNPVVTPVVAGDDTVFGDDGEDVIFGQGGNDQLDGGADNDALDGGIGNDTLTGGIGRDALTGGEGDDVLAGGDDNDTIDGGNGNDRIDGGQGADDIAAGAGNDTIDGGTGNDTIDGGAGDDSIAGGAGDDSLTAGAGFDNVDGGTGNDTILGGGDNDNLNGGDDADTILITSLNGLPVTNTTVDGGSGGNDSDTLNIGQLIADGWTVTNFVKNQDGDTGAPGGADQPSFLGQIQLVRGTESANINFTEIENVIICFTPGTLIATPRGEVPVERLRMGDRVFTRDNGIQPIRWTGRRDLTAVDLAATPAFRPVRIAAGSLGNGLPEADMLVSPNHRMLLTWKQAELLFDEREVLVAAKHMTAMPGVTRVLADSVSYIHMLFDHHEVILANGAWTESFQPGDHSLRGLASAQRDEILSLFPALRDTVGAASYSEARRSLRSHEARAMMSARSR